MEVEFPKRAADWLNLSFLTLELADRMESGIQSINWAEFLFQMLNKHESISDEEAPPLKIAAAANIFPFERFVMQNEFQESNISLIKSITSSFSKFWSWLLTNGATVVVKKWTLGKGVIFVAIFLSPAFCMPPNRRDDVVWRMFC